MQEISPDKIENVPTSCLKFSIFNIAFKTMTADSAPNGGLGSGGRGVTAISVITRVRTNRSIYNTD